MHGKPGLSNFQRTNLPPFGPFQEPWGQSSHLCQAHIWPYIHTGRCPWSLEKCIGFPGVVNHQTQMPRAQLRAPGQEAKAPSC